MPALIRHAAGGRLYHTALSFLKTFHFISAIHVLPLTCKHNHSQLCRWLGCHANAGARARGYCAGLSSTSPATSARPKSIPDLNPVFNRSFHLSRSTCLNFYNGQIGFAKTSVSYIHIHINSVHLSEEKQRNCYAVIIHYRKIGLYLISDNKFPYHVLDCFHSIHNNNY